MLQSLNKGYVVLHRSPDGEGSGYTIVVANSERMARLMVWQYLSQKPMGYAQCSNSNLLEVELLEESSLFREVGWTLPMDKVGIKQESCLCTIDGAEQLRMVAYRPDEKSWLTYGGGGHPKEYLLNVAGHDHDDYIPDSISKSLQALLPGFDVCNRGSRIEIVGKKPYGFRDDAAVVAAVKKLVGENLDSSHL